MKVSNNKIGAATTPKSAKAEAAALKKDLKGGSSVGAREIASGGANVNVSERAQMMGKAREIASKPSDVDEAKVARLQKMIDEGSYKMDADKIADKLVDEHMLIPD